VPPVEEAFDGDGDLLEALVRDVEQALAGFAADRGLVVVEDLEEGLDGLETGDLGREVREANEAHLLLPVLVAGEGVLDGRGDRARQHLLVGGVEERVLGGPQDAVGIEQ
jgi:hypothetical protein